MKLLWLLPLLMLGCAKPEASTGAGGGAAYASRVVCDSVNYLNYAEGERMHYEWIKYSATSADVTCSVTNPSGTTYTKSLHISDGWAQYGTCEVEYTAEPGVSGQYRFESDLRPLYFGPVLGTYLVPYFTDEDCN